jgi:hypothetical protein
MLRWMEEYARRLQEGWYTVKNLWDDDITRGVCLYPEAGPALAEAVTRGVKVREKRLRQKAPVREAPEDTAFPQGVTILLFCCT